MFKMIKKINNALKKPRVLKKTLKNNIFLKYHNFAQFEFFFGFFLNRL